MLPVAIGPESAVNNSALWSLRLCTYTVAAFASVAVITIELAEVIVLGG